MGTNWQGMDTAPLDGTAVLVLFRGHVYVAEFRAFIHPDNLRWCVPTPPTGLQDERRAIMDIGPHTWPDDAPLFGHHGPTAWAPIPQQDHAKSQKEQER